MSNILEIKGLSAGYGPLRVIHDLDLIIQSGERVGIVGLNGHGKTTLFYAIAGLTHWQRGSIKISGKEIGRTRSQGPGRYTHIVVKEGLAIMPQGDEIFHGLTVEEHLDSGAFTPESWKNRKQQREKILEIFEPLKKLIHTPVGRLSGGERRMVSIGRGMMSEAKLYMADEPTLGLAPKIGKGVLEALLKIDLKDSAMIIAEQNVALLEGKVDRIIGMHAGKLKGEASSSLSMGLTWSALGLLNLSYGFIFSFAGYGAWLAERHIYGEPIFVMFMGITAGIIGGIMVCLIVFIPVHDKPNFTIRGMIGTLAVSLIGGQILLQNFGPKAKLLPEFFGYGKIKILDVTLTADKIGIICSSILMLTIVVRWMKSSRRGLEIRAMMMNPHAASIVGIGVRKTGIYVMAVTGAMTGLSAALLSQTYYLSPFSGLTPMIKGVSIALMGGLGSVRGAVIAAIILGFNEALTTKFLGGRYVLMTQFALIIIVLIIRPRGIAGILDKAREA
jgi:ABC-type branched-subunit amino acid transport system ATPase component/branched-subunit amino acid ABC-type transport system permease component